MSSSKFYVTTPIYYVNGQPHIGHAYTTIAADVLARYHKRNGADVFFATGTDEHGQKVAKAAEEKGVPPLEFTNEISQTFVKLWELLDVQNSDFIRTTDERHQKKVKHFLKTLFDKGDIYQGEYEGWYCVPCETFFPEGQLKEGSCPDCGRSVESLKEKSYFFRLSKYQDWLIEYIQDNDLVVPQTRQNEVLGFLRQPLEDLCISRPKERLTWGIPLPFDEDHVTYVWFDALVNYISILSDKDNFEKFWPCDAHLIGKDILRPHAVFWPIMLYAMDLPLPKKIVVHGWWTVKGEKMSKSKGNVLDPYDVVEEFGLDAVRYFLLREVPFGSDGTFSRKQIIQRINSELGNDLGNFVSRSIGMLSKYCDGVVPEYPEVLGELEIEIEDLYQKVLHDMDQAMTDVKFSVALESAMEYMRRMNRYVEEVGPWVLAKDESQKERLQDVMAYLMQAIVRMAYLIDPFMPQTAAKIYDHLSVSEDELTTGVVARGRQVEKITALFPRLEFDEEEQVK